jgi:4-hydroxy-3-methylbut-2-enyl diphosphate reductase
LCCKACAATLPGKAPAAAPLTPLEGSNPIRVLRAKPTGICAGVRRALQVAERIDLPETVTIHGQLVHNEAVQARLQSRGFLIRDEGDGTGLPETPNVLITAHGLSDRRRQNLQAAGRRLIDTTCPLVRRLHRTALAMQADGHHVLLIGRPDHVEVLGIVEDLSSYDVLSDVADVRTYPHRRLGIVCQTTTPPHLAEEIHLAVRMRNLLAEVRFENTICRATRDRQRAVEKLLPQVDAIVVVGGRGSNNTRELADLCRRKGVRTYHVQSAQDIDPGWFRDCRTVGLCAGTSTEEHTIQEVYEALCHLSTESDSAAVWEAAAAIAAGAARAPGASG